jgi:hypothetical protein
MDPHDCEFCGKRLPDPMLGFVEHLDESPTCREVWVAWRENVRREAGSA